MIAYKTEGKRGAVMQRIAEYLESHAQMTPENLAIYISETETLNYRQLAEQTKFLTDKLAASGLKNQRIALMLPHGAITFLMFLAIIYENTVIPLNPDLSAAEAEEYLLAAGANALILGATNSSVRQVAEKLALTILTIAPSATLPYNFTSIKQEARKTDPKKKTTDTAVLLFTSGTTEKSKVVALSQENLLAAAQNSVKPFSFSAKDCFLSSIPLHHIFGIHSGLTGPIVLGASVIFLAPFNAAHFFELLKKYPVTTYAGSPAIHKTVIGYAERHGIKQPLNSLRVIRSGGAYLPDKVAAKLESLFDTMVTQGYGLTETASMGALSPLKSSHKRPGSIGRANGCQIKITDTYGLTLPPNEIGEILIKAPGNMQGYANLDNTAQYFDAENYFITGDQGYLDEDGFLFITGRIKDLINRGGVKISPYEVENIFYQHPAVDEVVVFAAPHSTLGEVPLAAVVIEKGCNLSTDELKSFVKDKLTWFKIPIKIFFLEQIPKNPTGKVQRQKLFQLIAAEFAMPTETELTVDKATSTIAAEEILTEIWCRLLDCETIHCDDNFFDLGGDSLLAMELFTEIEQCFNISLAADTLVEYDTIEKLGKLLQRENAAVVSDIIKTFNKTGSQQPLFFIHNRSGDILTYRLLVENLKKDRPMYGIIFFEKEGQDVPHELTALVTYYMEEIKKFQPQGPYYLAGHSLGGIIAYEMARQLKNAEQEVAFLALIDTWLSRGTHKKTFAERISKGIKRFNEQSVTTALPFLVNKTRKEILRIKEQLSKKKIRN